MFALALAYNVDLEPFDTDAGRSTCVLDVRDILDCVLFSVQLCLTACRCILCMWLRFMEMMVLCSYVGSFVMYLFIKGCACLGINTTHAKEFKCTYLLSVY